MTDLVEIKNNQVVVSSRQVAENFGKLHKDVLEIIRTNIKAENSALTNWYQETTYKAGTGKQYPMYLMNRDGFSLLVMGFTGKKALEWKVKYINAFNEMEKQLQNPFYNQIPKDLPSALIAYGNALRDNKKLELKLEKAKPKIILADAITESKTSISIGDLAKILKQKGINIGRNRLFTFLREKGYLIRKTCSEFNSPTQKAMKLELFEIKETPIELLNGEKIISKAVKVTGKGQLYFINLFRKELFS